MTRALLIVTTSYPRAGDGSEAAGSFVADLALELSRSIPVRVVAPGNATAVESAGEGLTVYRFAAPATTLSNLKLSNPLQALAIAGVLRRGARAVRAAAADGAVVHTLACWALPCGWWARGLQRSAGVPYSVWMLGSDVWSLGRIPLVRGFLRSAMRDAAMRYADGLQLAEDSRRIAGKDVEFLPSTRHLETRDPPPPAAEPPFRLCFIGRWHPNKGVDLLLDALALLDADDWRRIASVQLYGGGPLEAAVRQKTLALRERGLPLELGGYLSKAAAERAIVAADYQLLPSRIESIPVIFSDAMKLGRPVIAMPVGDLPSLYANAAAGVLAERADAAAFAAAMRRAIRRSPREFEAAVNLQAAAFDLGRIAARLLRRIVPAA